MKKTSSTAIINRDEIEYYLRDIRQYEVLTDTEYKKVMSKLRDLGNTPNNSIKKQICKKLIESNLRFVVSVAKEYQGNGLALADLISEGNYGLLCALERFDPNREIRFISYAVHWIRQSILAAIYTKGSTIKLPINIVQERNRTKKKLSKDDVFLLNDQADFNSDIPTCVYLDNSIDEDGNTLHDVLKNPNAESPDAHLVGSNDLKSELTRLLSQLNDRERIIIEDYYGLTGSQRTLDDLGTELGLTKERVRQIKDKALKKLRNESSELFQYL